MHVDDFVEDPAGRWFDVDSEREERILEGIERRNRRMLRTAVGALIVVVAVSIAMYVLLPDSPVEKVFSRDDAVTAVVAQDAMFVDAIEFNPEMIGVSDWWSVEETSQGWLVTMRLGWGDCQAGCISEHRYRYQVTAESVILVESFGDPISTRP